MTGTPHRSSPHGPAPLLKPGGARDLLRAVSPLCSSAVSPSRRRGNVPFTFLASTVSDSVWVLDEQLYTGRTRRSFVIIVVVSDSVWVLGRADQFCTQFLGTVVIGVLRADKRKVGPAVSTGYTWNLLTWNFTEADGRRRVHISTDSYAYATNTDTGHAHQFFFFDESSTCFLSSNR